MAGSQLQLLMPVDMLDLTEAGTGFCCFSYNNVPASPHMCEAWLSADSTYFEVNTEPVLSSSVSDDVTLVITGIFRNPIQALLPTDSVQLKIRNEDFAVAETPASSSLYVIPPLRIEDLASLEMTQESLVAGENTTFFFEFILTQAVPADSKLILKLAPETLIDYDGGAKMKCLT